MTRREAISKTANTVIALAVTAGLVLLMREVAGQIVTRFGLDGGSAAAGGEIPMPLEPAPRIYDLGLLIPENLRDNVGGARCRVESRRELAPEPVVRERLLNEFRARGWQRLEPTVAEMASSPMTAMEDAFITPQGEYVTVGLLPDGDGGTAVSEWRFPFAVLPQPDRNAASPLRDAASRCGPLLRRQLPKVIAELVVGDPIESRLISRNGGYGYHLIFVANGEVDAAARAFGERALKAGWTAETDLDWKGTERFLKANLSLFCQFLPYGTGHCIAVCRFADDENLILTNNTKGKENEE